jgi:WhiB family redox-sensing transcriptional regulator
MEMKIENLLDTQGVTVAYAHPTPRHATSAWSCAGYDDPDVFDPTDQDALAEARAVCAGCEVRAVCFALGTSRGEWGVWGGVLLDGGKPIEKVKQPGRPKKSTSTAA